MSGIADWVEVRHIILLMTLVISLAGFQDIVSRRISNLFPAAIVVLFVIAGTVAGWRADAWQNIMSFGLVFVAGCFLFNCGILGGGDVKLWSAAALWFKLSQLPLLLLCISLAGGVMAAAVLARSALMRRSMPDGRRADSMKAARSVPYGVAIALGTVVTIAITGAGVKWEYRSDPAYRALDQALMATVTR